MANCGTINVNGSSGEDEIRNEKNGTLTSNDC